jgi:hypothetical protein
MIIVNQFFSNNYLRGSLFFIFLFISGVFFNVLFGIDSINIPAFPGNLYILILLTLLHIIIFFYFKKKKFIEWLSKSSLFITSFSGYLIYELFKILIKQNILTIKLQFIDSPNLLTSGWAYLLIRLFLITCLYFSILNYIYPLKGKYFGLIFFRLGIWLVLIALWFGLPDKQIFYINLLENGEKSNYGVSSSDKIIEMPFYLQLIDFKFNNNNYSILSKNYWKNIYFTKIRKKNDISSLLVITNDSIRNDTVLLTLFEPINLKGWYLYQKGYDESKGSSSTLSIIKAEKDPWKQMSVSGYISIILGSLLFFIFLKPKAKHPAFLPEHYK